MADEWRTDEPQIGQFAWIDTPKEIKLARCGTICGTIYGKKFWEINEFKFWPIDVEWLPITTPEEERLRAKVRELEEENKLLHDCRDACAGFHRDWLSLGRDRPQTMTNRLVFEAGERFLIGPKTEAKGVRDDPGHQRQC